MGLGRKVIELFCAIECRPHYLDTRSAALSNFPRQFLQRRTGRVAATQVYEGYFGLFGKNASVKPNDVLYFLGDFCMGSQIRVRAYRRRSQCKKIFAVPGNHNKQLCKLEAEFSWLADLTEVSVHGQPIVLCHYALRAWNRSNRGSWHLYWHSHGRLPEANVSLSLDVEVDTHDFQPWQFDEIIQIMREKAANQSSHLL